MERETRLNQAGTPRGGSGQRAAMPAKTLFERRIKSVGPRSYAAEVKEAGNGNHFLVLSESRPDADTNRERTTRLFVFSEDFPEFFRLMRDAAVWIKEHPLSDELKQKRQRFWARQAAEHAGGSSSSSAGRGPNNNFKTARPNITPTTGRATR